jgi:hypothetical protein
MLIRVRRSIGGSSGNNEGTPCFQAETLKSNTEVASFASSRAGGKTTY